MESCSVTLSQTVVAIQASANKYCESMSELAALFRSGLDITLLYCMHFITAIDWMSWLVSSSQQQTSWIICFLCWNSLTSDGLPISYTQEELYDRVVSLRTNIKQEKQQLTELQFLFNYVRKMMESVAETSFLGLFYNSLFVVYVLWQFVFSWGGVCFNSGIITAGWSRESGEGCGHVSWYC